MKPKLDVLICTFAKEGILRVADMDLPHVEGVRYIVSWQTAGADSNDCPDSLNRDDIIVSPIDSVGSSNNRNHAIAISSAPICLTADDDLKYTAAQLLNVVKTFEDNPDIDLASFRYSGPDNKEYPAEETDLNFPLPKDFYSTSFEIAFRREAVASHIFYNPFFGINSPRLVCGDDSVFLLDCINKGLRCRFFPVTITHHEGLSSGARLFSKPAFLMTQGAYIRYAYGLKGIPRLPLFIWRNRKISNLNILSMLRHVLRGFFYKVPKGAH